MEELIAEGEERGIAKGEAKSLTRLLERRFGPLPAAVKARVGGVNFAQLDGSTGCQMLRAWMRCSGRGIRRLFGGGECRVRSLNFRQHTKTGAGQVMPNKHRSVANPLVSNRLQTSLTVFGAG